MLREFGAKQHLHFSGKSWAELRGTESIDLNQHVVLVQPPVEQVSQVLCQLRKANIWQQDVFEREVELTNQYFIVLRFAGHSWTVVYHNCVWQESDTQPFPIC